jgi:hypothetical protein
MEQLTWGSSDLGAGGSNGLVEQDFATRHDLAHSVEVILVPRKDGEPLFQGVEEDCRLLLSYET